MARLRFRAIAAARNRKGEAVAAPRPGIEPGTPRSKRGMISVSPPSQARNSQMSNDECRLVPSTFDIRHLLISPVDLMGVEPITPILQGSVAASGMEARILE